MEATFRGNGRYTSLRYCSSPWIDRRTKFSRDTVLPQNVTRSSVDALHRDEGTYTLYTRRDAPPHTSFTSNKLGSYRSCTCSLLKKERRAARTQLRRDRSNIAIALAGLCSWPPHSRLPVSCYMRIIEFPNTIAGAYVCVAFPNSPLCRACIYTVNRIPPSFGIKACSNYKLDTVYPGHLTGVCTLFTAPNQAIWLIGTSPPPAPEVNTT